MNKFVIISYPRTGSTFLVKVLNSCSNIICHSEIFHPDRDAFNRSFLNDNVLLPITFIDKLQNKTSLDKLASMRKRNPVKFLEHIYSQGAEAIGFKIFPGQDAEMMEYLLNDHSITKILLARKSRIDSYVSQTLAETTGKWDLLGEEKAELKKIEVDMDKFTQYKNGIDHDITSIKKKLKDTQQQCLALDYGEIIQEFPTQKIENYLSSSLTDIDLSINQKKQNPFPLEDMISNYHEVKSLIEDKKC